MMVIYALIALSENELAAPVITIAGLFVKSALVFLQSLAVIF